MGVISKYIIKGSHMFVHALTFAGSTRSGLNRRLFGGVFKHSPKDPGSVNAIKQTCVIVIHAFLPDFNLNRTENVA